MASAATSTDIVERTPQQELVAFIRSDEARAQIRAALPANVSLDRFERATASAIITNPDLVQADRTSLFQAVVKCAMDGLLPDGREAAITIYKDTRNNRKVAQYLPMIGGYRKIAGDHGWQIVARVVYAADVFEYEEGLEPKLRHVRARPGAERGARIAAYATARHISGAVAAPVVMYADDIAKRQAKAQTDRVWKEWTDRMWEKTVGKAIFKELPIGELDERVARVLVAEDMTVDEKTGLLYGPSREVTPAAVGANEPADGGGSLGTTAAAGQQVELPDPSLSGGSTPDFPDEPSTEDEPPHSAFPIPDEAAQAAKDIADAAGRFVVDRGNVQGKTLAEVATSRNGASWFRWIIAGKPGEPPPLDHPARSDALTYARVYMPEVYTAAMAELQVKEQVS